MHEFVDSVLRGQQYRSSRTSRSQSRLFDVKTSFSRH